VKDQAKRVAILTALLTGEEYALTVAKMTGLKQITKIGMKQNSD
jgi:hypothetical protein